MANLKEAEYLYIEHNYERFISKIRQGKDLVYDDNIIVYNALTEYIVKQLNGNRYDLYLSDLACMITKVEDFPTFNVVQMIISSSNKVLTNLNCILFTMYHCNRALFYEMLSHAKALLSAEKYLKLFDILSANVKLVLDDIDQICLIDMINGVNNPSIACDLFESLDVKNKIAMKGLYRYLVENAELEEIRYVLANKKKLDVDIVKRAISVLVRNTDEEIVVPCIAEYSAKDKDELFEYLIRQFANDNDLRYKLCDKFIMANPWLTKIYVTYGKEDFACAGSNVTRLGKKHSLDSLDYALKDQDKHNKKIIDYFLRLGVLAYVINDLTADVVDDFFERRIGASEKDANTYLIYHEFITERGLEDERTSKRVRFNNIVKTDDRYLAMCRLLNNEHTPSPIYEYLNKGTISKKKKNNTDKK